MKLIFFEVQDWEKDTLHRSFPKAFLSKEKLTINNVNKYQQAEIISTFIYSQLSRELLNKLPRLRFISTRSTGYDHIDLSYCQKKNIQVANVPEYGSHTVAEHTFALILTLTRKIYQSINQTKQLNFKSKDITGIDLYGRTIGIIGLGKIGQEVLKIARGFGMKILVYTRTQGEELAKKWSFQYVDFDFLLQNSDIITLHVPYNKQTHHLINKKNILKLKKGSYLINTARGGIIETEAIILGLEKGVLSGVGLDVLEGERALKEEIEILTSVYKETVDFKTLFLDHLLVNHPKIVITPHNAFNSQEALMRIVETTIDNINSFLKSSPINLISKPCQ